MKTTTFQQRLYPKSKEFVQLAQSWKPDAIKCMLGNVMDGYSLLKKEVLSQLKPQQTDKDLERSITQLLEPRINKAMRKDAFSPYCIQQGTYEQETSLPPPAQPPEYDLAFVWYENPRITWPLEAKVLRTDGQVAEYVKEIRANFLSCRYAPFSSEAAMIGYLLQGSTNTVLVNIGKKGHWKLYNHPHLPKKSNRISRHNRKPPKGKPYPKRFCCHHLILKMF